MPDPAAPAPQPAEAGHPITSEQIETWCRLLEAGWQPDPALWRRLFAALAASRAEASALRAALEEIHGKTHALFASPWSRDSLMLQETMTRQARQIEEILLIAQAALGQEG